eukprot:1869500-Prymnesium_polylepis.1
MPLLPVYAGWTMPHQDKPTRVPDQCEGVCMLCECVVQTCSAMCVRAAHRRKPRTKGKSTRVGYHTHPLAWVHPMGGAYCAALGCAAAGTSPPTAVEMRCFPPTCP